MPWNSPQRRKNQDKNGNSRGVIISLERDQDDEILGFDLVFAG